MAGLREYINSSRGRNSVIVVVLVGLLALILSTIFSRNSVEAQVDQRWFVDSTNMQPFRHSLREGEAIPVTAPSGGKTGYPAELCFWTADGQIKKDPTPVLLNSWLGKPGPTFCPDCGRLVVPHNPLPVQGMKPPPTKMEWLNMHAPAGDERDQR